MEDREVATVIVVLCAWCGKHLGTKDGQGVSGVSHGMCQDCARAFLEELELEGVAESTLSS
jgi:hypothetical protein